MSRRGIAKGGKALYGAPLGVLMLEARFPRIFGDMGNATTWPFPVLYRVVSGASPEKVVLKGAAGLLPDFVAAAQELVRHGAEAITTNCGFLSLFQQELAAAVGVPVATSSLMQVPWVQATAAGQTRRPRHRIGGDADAAAPCGRRRSRRHTGHRHRERPRILPRADQGGEGGDGHRPRRAGRGRGGPATGR